MDEVDKLIDDLKHPNSDVRWKAATALGEIKDARAVKPLIEALNDAQWNVSGEALYALVQIGEAARESLMATLRHASQDTEALRVICRGPHIEREVDRGRAYETRKRAVFYSSVAWALSNMSQAAAQIRDEEAAAYFFYRNFADCLRGDSEGAIANLTEALRVRPEFAEAYCSRGNLYHAQGDNDRAIEDLSKAVQIDPYLAEAYRDRGIVYSDQGRYDQAIREFTNALRIDADFAEAYAYRGQAYFRRDDYDQAMADVNQAVQISPEFAEAYYIRAMFYGAQEEYELARRDWEKALQLDPNGPTGEKARNWLRRVGRARGSGGLGCLCGGMRLGGLLIVFCSSMAYSGLFYLLSVAYRVKHHVRRLLFGPTLHDAVVAGDMAMAQELIAKGADVNRRAELGATPLHKTCGQDLVELAELLIANGAHADARAAYDSTPLHTAVRNRSVGVARVLLENGADPNSYSTHRNTPLHAAVFVGSEPIAELLLSHGADINARGPSGLTPLDGAIEMNNTKMADFIISYQGKTSLAMDERESTAGWRPGETPVLPIT